MSQMPKSQLHFLGSILLINWQCVVIETEYKTMTFAFAATICYTLILPIYTTVSSRTDKAHAITSPLEVKSASTWETSVANKWQPFYGWSTNSPPARQYAAATEILYTKLDGTRREMMLIYGGDDTSSDHRTWIYDAEANSWEAVRRRSGPEGIIHHTLVSLCKTRVLLFGGFSNSASSRNDVCSNETWMFEMTRMEWWRVDTTIYSQNGDVYVTPRCGHVATVVRSDNSSCVCKDSMIMYSGFEDRHGMGTLRRSHPLGDLWLLTCKNDTLRLYEWLRLDPTPPKLYYPSLTSAFNNSIVYFYGFSLTRGPSRWATGEVWSYCLANATWKRHANSSNHKLRSGQTIYFSNSERSQHFLVLCCSGHLDVFNLTENVWFQPSISTSVPELVESHIIVTKVGNKAIVFGRQYIAMAAPNRMWYVNMSDESLWNFSPILPPKLTPIKSRYFSVGGLMSKQQEILVHGGVTILEDSHTSDADNFLHRLDLKTLQWSKDILGSSAEATLHYAEFSTATVLLDSVLVVYGGVKFPSKLSFLSDSILSTVEDTWGYYNQETARLWLKYSTEERRPRARLLHAAAAVDSQTMVVYGGIECEIRHWFRPKLNFSMICGISLYRS